MRRDVNGSRRGSGRNHYRRRSDYNRSRRNHHRGRIGNDRRGSLNHGSRCSLNGCGRFGCRLGCGRGHNRLLDGRGGLGSNDRYGCGCGLVVCIGNGEPAESNPYGHESRQSPNNC